MKKSVKVLLTVLCIVCVCVFGVSAYKVYQTVFAPGGYYQSNKNAKEVQQAYVKPVTVTPPAGTSSSGEVQATAAPTPAQIVLDPEVSPIEVDFESLKQRNADIVGWIYCPNTVINYPICQTDDNMFYLHKDIDGNYSSYGTLFMECCNQKGFKDTNNLIYGHHMNDGKMFARLVDYSYQNFYDEHPVMYLNTPEMNYRIELFSGYVTSMDSDSYKISFTSETEYRQWLDSIISQSKFHSNVDVKTSDRILTLSTCTYDYDDARFVVQGKMVPIH